MENEIWKDIPNYEGVYQVSNFGRVKSLPRIRNHRNNTSYYTKEKIVNGNIVRGGYLSFGLNKNSKIKHYRIHQIVAMAFLGHKPNGTSDIVVDHIDDNRINNRVENLRLVTQRENTSKRVRGKSKYLGAHWHSFHKKWCSSINFNKKVIYLGYFETELEAHQAYMNKLKEISND
jgi:hypothetical protein